MAMSFDEKFTQCIRNLKMWIYQIVLEMRQICLLILWNYWLYSQKEMA